MGCCIVSGGPAGIMLGFLLARAGIEVLVLEKHGDFLRDFRGDTVHPSTLEIMHEVGLLEEFLKRPHQEVSQVPARIAGEPVILGDMSYLQTQCRFRRGVRKFRHAKGVSQEKLAEDAEIHRTYVGDVERGVRNIALTRPDSRNPGGDAWAAGCEREIPSRPSWLYL